MTASIAVSAETNIIDFEAIQPPDASDPIYVGMTYSEKGFIFGAIDGTWGFSSFQTASPYYNGSKALFNGTANGFTSLSRTNGGFFDFLNLQMSGVQYPIGGAPITFSGYRVDQLVVSTNVNFPGLPGIYPLAFTGFTNLTEVRWSAVPGSQFDNIRVVSRTNTPFAQRIQIMDVDSVVLLSLTSLRVGKQYTVQKSADLITWSNLTSIVPASPVQNAGDPNFPPKLRMFYRLKWTE